MACNCGSPVKAGAKFCNTCGNPVTGVSQALADEFVDCPYCAEPIKPKAIKCKHCQTELQPVRTTRRRSRRSPQGARDLQEIEGGDFEKFAFEFDQRKKSVGLAYAFWFFLGWFGIHKFYLGKTTAGVFYLILGLSAISTMWLLGLGLIPLCLLGILLFVDLFCLSGEVESVNSNLRNNLLGGY